VLEKSGGKLTELLPDHVLKKFELPELGKAITYVHRPPPDAITQQLMDGTHPAQQRLAFEELLAQYLSLQRLRNQLRAHMATPLNNDHVLSASFLKSLPFNLTGAQQRCADEISR